MGGRVMVAGAQGMGRKAMAGGAPRLEVRRWEACQSRTRPRVLTVDPVTGAARRPEPDAGAARQQDPGAGGTEARSRQWGGGRTRATAGMGQRWCGRWGRLGRSWWAGRTRLMDRPGLF